MATAVARDNIGNYDEFMAQYAKYGGEPITREQAAEKICACGENGPAAGLHNGLDDEQNRALFDTTDPILMAELVLTGLENLGI